MSNRHKILGMVLVVFLGYLVFSLKYLYLHYEDNMLSLSSYLLQFKFIVIPQEQVKTFVINLDRSPERYAKIKSQLDQNNIKHERFKAVDGYELEIIDIQTKDKFSGKTLRTSRMNRLSADRSYGVLCPSFIVQYHAKPINDRLMTAGEFGCYCSHREIWQRILNDNINYALILEDDTILPNDFYNKFNKLISHLPDRWDIIYLYARLPDVKSAKILNNETLEKILSDHRHVDGTVGYVINLHTVKKLLNLSREFSLPIDTLISEEINNNSIIAYTAMHYINIQTLPESTIREMGRP